MKIQKQLSKKRGDKIYYRYVVTLPEETLKDAELKEGDDVEITAEKNKIVLKKK